ncbi:MAG: Flagellar protein FlaG [Nitrospira sp.]|jgi:flagellar protein FlaG|nr:MAG: Flagellar protein FlaG [Nitrospira sp.]
MLQEVSSRTNLLTTAATNQNALQHPPERDDEHAIAEPQPSTPEVKDKDLDQALSRVREVFQQADPRLEFTIDPDLDRVVVKVMNAESGEVIRQIPQREVIELAKSLEAPTGLLLHHKV